MTRIRGFEPEDVVEKCAVRLSVFTLDKSRERQKSSASHNECPELLADYMFRGTRNFDQDPIRILPVNRHWVFSLG